LSHAATIYDFKSLSILIDQAKLNSYEFAKHKYDLIALNLFMTKNIVQAHSLIVAFDLLIAVYIY